MITYKDAAQSWYTYAAWCIPKGSILSSYVTSLTQHDATGAVELIELDLPS